MFAVSNKTSDLQEISAGHHKFISPYESKRDAATLEKSLAEHDDLLKSWRHGHPYFYGWTMFVLLPMPGFTHGSQRKLTHRIARHRPGLVRPSKHSANENKDSIAFPC
jgi:hypothetical protein